MRIGNGDVVMWREPILSVPSLCPRISPRPFAALTLEPSPSFPHTALSLELSLPHPTLFPWIPPPRHRGRREPLPLHHRVLGQAQGP